MKTNHTDALHAAAEQAGLQAVKAQHGWHLLDKRSGARVSPPDASYDARAARAFAEGWSAAKGASRGE